MHDYRCSFFLKVVIIPVCYQNPMFTGQKIINNRLPANILSCGPAVMQS